MRERGIGRNGLQRPLVIGKPSITAPTLPLRPQTVKI
jgi:hypothetical protein